MCNIDIQRKFEIAIYLVSTASTAHDLFPSSNINRRRCALSFFSGNFKILSYIYNVFLNRERKVIRSHNNDSKLNSENYQVGADFDSLFSMKQKVSAACSFEISI